MNSPVRMGVSLTTQIPTGFYSQRFWGFISLSWHPGLHGLAPQLFLPVYLHENVGPPSLPAAASPALVLQPPPCRASSLPQLLVSAPPTILNVCFFFNSSVVGLLYSLIFCQFWLFFVFKFVFVLLLVVWAGTVYLVTPPCWPEVWAMFYNEAKTNQPNKQKHTKKQTQT